MTSEVISLSKRDEEQAFIYLLLSLDKTLANYNLSETEMFQLAQTVELFLRHRGYYRGIQDPSC